MRKHSPSPYQAYLANTAYFFGIVALIVIGLGYLGTQAAKQFVTAIIWM